MTKIVSGHLRSTETLDKSSGATRLDPSGKAKKAEGSIKTEVVRPDSKVLPSSVDVWSSIKIALSGEPENKPYSDAMSKVLKVKTYEFNEDRKKAIVQNCDWIIKNSQKVLEQADKNLDAGKDPWDGLMTEGVPMSAKLKKLSGDTQAEKYYHNAYLNYLAKKVKLAVEKGVELRFYFDVDGCISSKTRRPDATRETQSLDQTFEFHASLEALSELLGAKSTTNSNRSSYTTNISKASKGLTPPLTDNAPHYGALLELAGLSPEECLEFLDHTGVGALSTGFRDDPESHTEVAFKLRLAYDLIREIDGFEKEFIINPAEKYECATTETKGLNELIMLQEGVSEKGLAPSYKGFVRINAIKQKFIKHGTAEEYRKYADEILANIEDRKTVSPVLEKLLAEFERKKRAINENNDSDLQISNHKIAEYQKELEQITLKSSFSKVPKLDLENDKASVKKTISAIKKAMVSYIQLPGEETPDAQFLKYTDSFGNVHEKDFYNLHLFLKENPQAFDEQIRRLALTSVCHHYDNPRNIRRSEMVPRQIENLERYENSEAKSGEKVRTLLKKAFKRAYETGKMRPDERLELEGYLKQAKSFFDGNESFESKYKNFLIWKLEKYAELKFSKESLKNSTVFDLSEDGKVAFKKEFLNSCDADEIYNLPLNINHFVEKLKTKLQALKTVESKIVTSGYIDDNFDKGFVYDMCEQFDPVTVSEENLFLYPDYLYCRNYAKESNGKPTLLAAFVLEDKRKDNLDYCELLPLLTKADIVSSYDETAEEKVINITYGDSKSDLPQHIKALFSSFEIDGEIHNGAAVKIYNLIGENDFLEKAIEEGQQIVNAAEKGKYKSFNLACEKAGLFGLEKVEGGYKKVIKAGSTKADRVYAEEGKVFTSEQIKKDYKVLFRHRIFANEAPDANIRRFAEAISWILGTDIEFVSTEFAKAQKLQKKEASKLNAEDRELIRKYRVPLAELEYCKYLPFDTPSSRKYIEYTDTETGKIYYRKAGCKTISTRDGEVFNGDISKLSKRSITYGITQDKRITYIYEDTKGTGKEEEFKDLEFLNKCYAEETVLPAPSEVKGIFSKKWALGLFGGEKGLRKAVSKMPYAFSGLLEWSGGLMALGGMIRLLSKPFGGSEGTVFKSGYWLSNIMRAVSAFGGGLRGIINPHKYYTITLGETINFFSALLFPNGPKHMGLAFGNTVLFTGRGIQSLQRQLATNLTATRSILNTGKTLDTKIGRSLDPKKEQTESTKFSTEETMIPIAEASKKHGFREFYADLAGSITSALLTPVKHIGDVIKDPSLLGIYEWSSQKSGKPFWNVRSVGHLLTLTGVLSGVGAVFSGIFGRSEKLGELSESGFNSWGKFGIAFATAIPALGIIANGKEVAANSEGLPMTTRGLDGKTINYNPRRAGRSQMLAGAAYFILPWFDLSKDWVAAAFDTFGTGLFFGIPGTGSGVAEEEKMTALLQAENMLFESDQYFLRPEKKILKPEDFRIAAGAAKTTTVI